MENKTLDAAYDFVSKNTAVVIVLTLNADTFHFLLVEIAKT